MEKLPSKVAHNRPNFFFQYCQPAQNQPRSHFLFHNDDSLRDFYIMTLGASIICPVIKKILKGPNFGRLYYMSACILAFIFDNYDFFHNLFKFVIWFFPKSKHITMVKVFFKSINPWKGPRFRVKVLKFLRFYIFEKGVKTYCDQWQWIRFMWFSKFCGGSLFLKITKNL